MITKDTSLDDIAESIAALATMVDQRFTGLESGQQSLKSQITDLQTGQRETNKRLGVVEDETIALRNDVKELYQLVH